MVLSDIFKLDFDDMVPHDKFMVLCKDQEEKIKCENILLCLYLLNQNFERIFNLTTRQIYFYSVQSISIIVKKNFGFNLKYNHLILLGLSQLIYRFTVAEKFQIPNKSQKQFRINSWGVQYVNNCLLNKNRHTIDKLNANIVCIINNELNEYKKLIALLCCDNIPKSIAEEIKVINSNLSIKLVA